jgi:hypothetical protein
VTLTKIHVSTFVNVTMYPQYNSNILILKKREMGHGSVSGFPEDSCGLACQESSLEGQ